ncbi:hypothetical protein [Pandoraea sp. ISTKB]|uniref:hypothetical protein n=1 Tax=Pandoraea sp. ISTKB TaxID=1586708 RepID=UPI0008473DA6|nr:hypothetical protein [Pandoraea sp. ISTKB]ODP34709.1 hypothetical protein A9762_13950 [Pandoraea sp. ISTKB]
MFEAITPEVGAALDKINDLVAANPLDARIENSVATLREVAQTVTQASVRCAEPLQRNEGHMVADGLIAAATICNKLRGM